MSAVFVDIFALFCGIAGWFYLFYSNAARRLAGIEPAADNLLRNRLRRLCGASLVLLAAAIYAGFNAIDEHRHPGLYLTVWMAAMVLLLIICALVATDIRLTHKLRQKKDQNREGKS
jgi:peptidoglycan/LPS O-acetylase OafA/YrhL